MKLFIEKVQRSSGLMRYQFAVYDIFKKKVFKNNNSNNTRYMFKFCTDRFSTYIDNVDDSRVE